MISGRPLRISLVLASALLGLVVLGNGWVSDDAFITLRSVHRLLAGDGFTWNAGERVQVFTHPLWAFALVPTLALVRSGWWAALLLGVMMTGGFIEALRRQASTGALLALLLLLASRSFVDFSTSGLENPLLHLLLLAVVLPGSTRRATWAGGLLLLTRLDTAPLLLPILAGRLWADRSAGAGPRTTAAALARVAGPAAVWMGFSLVYFGALLPNSALAKLGAGLPKGEVLAQGWHYLVASATADPAGAALITLGLGLGALRPRSRWVAVGLAAHLGYVVWVGGDFMLGRFLTVDLAVAAGLLAQTHPPPRWVGAGALVAAVCVALAPFPTLRSPTHGTGADPSSFIDDRGVADERRYYTPGSALVGWRPGVSMPVHRFRSRAEDLTRDRPVSPTGVGMTGFFGLDLRIVDTTGVADPFLARLPARPGQTRPGHLHRALPHGYRHWFDDPLCDLRSWDNNDLCDDVRRVSRGPLFAPGRGGAIVRILRGDLAQILGRPRPELPGRER